MFVKGSEVQKYIVGAISVLYPLYITLLSHVSALRFVVYRSVYIHNKCS